MDDVGELILAGGPIGDVGDASPAFRRAVLAADVVAAEDTRKFKALSQRLGIEPSGRLVSFFDGNEAERVPGLVAELLAGRRVVVVTDAGMPSVSDPGFRLVGAAIEAGVRVRVVPGASAVLAALAVSGLPTDRFCFEGFLPRKSGERRSRLAGLVAEPRTMVFFEAPHRLAEFLADAAAVLGPERRAVVCRELTKTHEEVRRGPLGGLADWASEGVRGEVTVVVAGAPEGSTAGSLADAVAEVTRQVAGGLRFSEAVAATAGAHGIARKALYAAALEGRQR